MMRSKEAITRREIEVLLLLAINENQTAAAIRRKLKKKVDKTSIWKTLLSLEKKGFIGNRLAPPPRETNPRGGRRAIKSYFIFYDKYDDIYRELKNRGYKFTPVTKRKVIIRKAENSFQLAEAKVVVSHPFLPDVDKRYSGEDIIDYQKRTGFFGPYEARAFREIFTEVRRATEEEIALHNILRNCSGIVQDAEVAERARDRYFLDGFWLGPLYAEDEE